MIRSLFCAIGPCNLFQHHHTPSTSIVPQCRRFLHLMYAATTGTSLGNHGIKDFVHAGFYQKQKPAPIDLWTEKPIRLVEQNVDI